MKVYIVTMEEDKEQQKQKLLKTSPSLKDGNTPGDDDDDSQDFGSYLSTDGESLLSLVQPEMKMLSKHWLAALKDYALLTLPAGSYVFDANAILKTRT
jgi:hypothetical protein